MAERELSRRTQELWRPIPGSLYPALRWLEDEGLVRSVTMDDRRRCFELTGTGRPQQAGHPGSPAPWETMVSSADQGDIAFRMVQAVGGAMLQPNALSTITNVVTDPVRRAQAIGVWAGVFGVAAASGPVLGGLLVAAVG